MIRPRDGPRFQRSNGKGLVSWGVAPGWYESAPLALNRYRLPSRQRVGLAGRAGGLETRDTAGSEACATRGVRNIRINLPCRRADSHGFVSFCRRFPFEGSGFGTAAVPVVCKTHPRRPGEWRLSPSPEQRHHDVTSNGWFSPGRHSGPAGGRRRRVCRGHRPVRQL